MKRDQYLNNSAVKIHQLSVISHRIKRVTELTTFLELGLRKAIFAEDAPKQEILDRAQKNAKEKCPILQQFTLPLTLTTQEVLTLQTGHTKVSLHVQGCPLAS